MAANPPNPPWRVQVHHINVGQGDSELILLYSGVSGESNGTLQKAVLVDAGGFFGCVAPRKTGSPLYFVGRIML